MKKIILLTLLFLSAIPLTPNVFADGAKKFKAPAEGLYFYCDPEKGSVERLEVTASNKVDLGDDEITFVCPGNSNSPSSCSLSSLVHEKGIKVKGDDAFSWTPTDCGAGCHFAAVQFFKIRSTIKTCTK